MAQERPAQILQIYRDRLVPGRESSFDAVEKDAARVCARLQFPNPHLAIESLSGPKEVWWLNTFASEVERARVSAEYASSAPLVAALADIGKRKEGLIGTPANILTTYRPDLSRGVAWRPEGARFVVVTTPRQDGPVEAAVFEAPDGSRYVFRPVRTREEADRAAAASGPGTTVFAVRPNWGMPAKDWIAADAEFWSVNPMASANEPVLLLKSEPVRPAKPQTGERPGPARGGARIRCPRCEWEPGPDDRWRCGCLHAWNTFDTRGVCPACGYEWLETQCLRCHEWSRHEDWYVPDESGS